MEPCAVITRIAETFLRFGSLEIAKTTDRMTGRAGPSAGNNEIITQLLDYIIRSFYSSIVDNEDKYKGTLHNIIWQKEILFFFIV